MRFAKDSSWMFTVACPCCEDDTIEIEAEHVRGPGVNYVGETGWFKQLCTCPVNISKDFIGSEVEREYYSGGW